MKQNDEIFVLIGAAMEVHNTLGPGLPEKCYQDAFAVELGIQNIPFEREKHLPVAYKGVTLPHDFFADFVCYGNIIVELKATTENESVFRSQVITYLKASGYSNGVLLNFGQKSLYYDRVFNF